jgi:hypothetical protein
MQSDWITAQSYQHSQSIVAAINDLLLGLKLSQRGIKTPERDQVIGEARQRLQAFFSAFENLAEQAELSVDKPLVGAMPSLCALAERLASSRRGSSPHLMRLRAEPIREVRLLLEADDLASQGRLLAYLSDLRTLLEEHAEDEAARIITEP